MYNNTYQVYSNKHPGALQFLSSNDIHETKFEQKRIWYPEANSEGILPPFSSKMCEWAFIRERCLLK